MNMSLQMLLGPIFGPSVGLYLLCPKKCLFIWSSNLVGHDKDIVSTWEGDCDILL